jgi:hypothetical protein
MSVWFEDTFLLDDNHFLGAPPPQPAQQIPHPDNYVGGGGGGVVNPGPQSLSEENEVLCPENQGHEDEDQPELAPLHLDNSDKPEVADNPFDRTMIPGLTSSSKEDEPSLTQALPIRTPPGTTTRRQTREEGIDLGPLHDQPFPPER